MTKSKIIINGLIIYITVISLFVFLMLVFNIDEILTNMNILLMTVLFIVSFIFLFNVIFLLKKTSYPYYKLLLIFNSIFCLLFSFRIRFNGWLISNQIGTQLSFFKVKNFAGSDFGFSFKWFDVVLLLSRYNDTGNDGYLFQVNLFMLVIGVSLFVAFLQSRVIAKDL